MADDDRQLPWPSACSRPETPAGVAALWRRRRVGPSRLDELLTADEVAELLHLPRSTVSDYARRGLLPSIKLGRHQRFVRSDVADAIERLRLGRAARGDPPPRQAVADRPRSALRSETSALARAALAGPHPAEHAQVLDTAGVAPLGPPPFA